MNQRAEGEQRRSPRSKVFLSATLEWPDQVLAVVLRDLSEHGALVETSGVMVLGSDVVLRRNNLCVEGHVAWIRGRFAGIAFASELKTEVVLEQIARPPPLAAEVAHRRPGLTTPGMSREERRWANEMMQDGKRRRRPGEPAS